MSETTKTSDNYLFDSLSEYYTPSMWFQVPKDFLLILDPGASILLAFLVSMSRSLKADKTDEGWFYCTTKKIESEIHMARRSQDVHLKKLRDRKLIETERRGNDGIRHIRIHYKNVQKFIKLALKKKPKIELEDSEQISMEVHPVTQDECGIPHATSASLYMIKDSVPKGTKKTQPCRLMEQKDTGEHNLSNRQRVNLLYSALAKSRKLLKRVNVPMWETCFAALSTSLDNETRLDNVLKWYCSHVGLKFIPEAFSAKSFCEKFPRIESSMLRQQDTLTDALHPKGVLIVETGLAPELSLSYSETELLKELTQTLRENLNIPIERGLPTLVQTSIQRIKVIVKKMRSLKEEEPDNDLNGYIDHLLSQMVPYSNYLLNHIQNNWLRLNRKTRYTGAISVIAFNASSESFLRWARLESIEYSSSDRFFNELFQAIAPESS